MIYYLGLNGNVYHRIQPEILGAKFEKLTVYSRKGCYLCEEMLDALAQVKAELGFTVSVYDIDEDDVLAEKFSVLVPVVELNGAIHWVLI